jgi:hypothetical protein
VRRRRAIAALAGGVVVVSTGLAAAAAAPKPAVAPDPKGDVQSPLDLTRVAVGRGTDGRLRASLTMAAGWDAATLKAAGGPPGSICLKAWTVSKPPDTTPDYLVCVTRAADGSLRGSVLQERANKLPVRVAGADVSRPTARTVTIRFAPSAIGAPAAVEAQGETTRAGCARLSCIDTAPDGGATLVVRLRAAR